MAKGYVIYNPLAGNGKSKEDAQLLQMVLDDELEFYDMTRITNYSAFFQGMAPEDYLILSGGDGTLHRFVNATAKIDYLPQVLLFPSGTGNDFARDLGKPVLAKPFPIRNYLKALPTVTVKGRQYRFINGVGFGIDGYCCEVGDRQKSKPGKQVNYVAIAVKGLLFHFSPRNAKITVDGKTYAHQRVWIAPTMFGRFYGGGMIPAPKQNRNAPEQTLSLMLFHGAGRLRTLLAFPGIFKGSHIKHTKMVTIYAGQEITVEFDRPTPLQIDGEMIPDVTHYTARSPMVRKNS